MDATIWDDEYGITRFVIKDEDSDISYHGYLYNGIYKQNFNSNIKDIESFRKDKEVILSLYKAIDKWFDEELSDLMYARDSLKACLS